MNAVMGDLDRLRRSLGGRVPVGVRDIWLHLYATCLSHTSEAATIPNLFQTMAAEATPGLSPSKVAGVAKAPRAMPQSPKAARPFPTVDIIMPELQWRNCVAQGAHDCRHRNGRAAAGTPCLLGEQLPAALSAWHPDPAWVSQYQHLADAADFVRRACADASLGGRNRTGNGEEAIWMDEPRPSTSN